MKNNSKIQVIVIAILIVGVVGLTIGFSSFSNSLFISSGASVSPNSDSFNVEFVTNDQGTVGNTVNATTTGDATGSAATISGTTISGLSASFTAPGQKVTYSFYSHNSGEYDAFLNTITFGPEGEGKVTAKSCNPNTGTTASLANAACEDITLSIKVGSDSALTSTDLDISGHSLTKNNYETVVVTIEYVSGGAIADGDFTIVFPDIELNYSSVD